MEHGTCAFTLGICTYEDDERGTVTYQDCVAGWPVDLIHHLPSQAWWWGNEGAIFKSRPWVPNVGQGIYPRITHLPNSIPHIPMENILLTAIAYWTLFVGEK